MKPNLHLENSDILRVRKSTLYRWFFLAGLIALSGAALQALIWASGKPKSIPAHPGPQVTSSASVGPVVKTQQPVRAPISGVKGYLVRVTAFSPQECRTSWCRTHAQDDHPW